MKIFAGWEVDYRKYSTLGFTRESEVLKKTTTMPCKECFFWKVVDMNGLFYTGRSLGATKKKKIMADINVNQSNLTFYFPTDKTDIMAVGFDKNRWQISSHHHHHYHHHNHHH